MSGTHTLENLVIYTVYLPQIKSYLKKNANYLVYFKILNGMNTSIRIPNCLTLARPRRISALREKCPKTKFFLIRIFPIQNEYEEILLISPCSVQMRKNTDQKKLRVLTLFTQC